MSDFRAELYARYVSTFKGRLSRPDPRELDAFFRWCKRRYLPLLRGLRPEDPILELGCGSGNMLEFLKHHGFRNVVGIDISAEQVEIAVERGLEARAADVFDALDPAAGRWAAILALDFVEHFDRSELMRLVPALHAALLDGGRLIVQTPNGSGLFPHQIIHGDLTHMTILSPESLSQLLRPWGFREIRYFETGPVAKDLRGKIRGQAWSLIRLAANAVRRIETGKSQEIWTENMICVCRRSDDGPPDASAGS